jgi:hypothetical protein
MSFVESARKTAEYDLGRKEALHGFKEDIDEVEVKIKEKRKMSPGLQLATVMILELRGRLDAKIKGHRHKDRTGLD